MIVISERQFEALREEGLRLAVSDLCAVTRCAYPVLARQLGPERLANAVRALVTGGRANGLELTAEWRRLVLAWAGSGLDPQTCLNRLGTPATAYHNLLRLEDFEVQRLRAAP